MLRNSLFAVISFISFFSLSSFITLITSFFCHSVTFTEVSPLSRFSLLCLCLSLWFHTFPLYHPSLSSLFTPLSLQFHASHPHFRLLHYCCNFTLFPVFFFNGSSLYPPFSPIFVYFFHSSLSLGYHINGLPSLSAAGRRLLTSSKGFSRSGSEKLTTLKKYEKKKEGKKD